MNAIVKSLEASRKLIEKHEQAIATVRESLRDDIDELEALWESINGAGEEMETAKRAIDDAIACLSQYAYR